MSTYALTYSFVPDILERREPHRAAHFAHLEKAIAEGHLLLAGPFDDPYDGGLLLLRFDSRGEAAAWATSDPYMRAGLVVNLSIKGYRIVAAAPDLAKLVEPK